MRQPQHDRDRLAQILASANIRSVPEGADGLAVHGSDTTAVGEIAFVNQIQLRELTARTASLEEAFLELTSEGQEFAAHRPVIPPPAAGGQGGTR